jgi:hypothetical protein
MSALPVHVLVFTALAGFAIAVPLSHHRELMQTFEAPSAPSAANQ